MINVIRVIKVIIVTKGPHIEDIRFENGDDHDYDDGYDDRYDGTDDNADTSFVTVSDVNEMSSHI
eukprot:3638947-Karenia_brevis.AAC.1